MKKQSNARMRSVYGPRIAPWVLAQNTLTLAHLWAQMNYAITVFHFEGMICCTMEVFFGGIFILYWGTAN